MKKRLLLLAPAPVRGSAAGAPINRKSLPCRQRSPSNAVASLRNGLEIYSLMGIGTKKTWDDVSNKVYRSAAEDREVE